MKEFREKFLSENNAGQICWSIEGIRTEMVIDWHKQSFKQFIDGLIAREEGEIKEFQTQKDGEYHFGENQKTIGWNLAKEFTIAHLKELKENITNQPLI